MKRNSQEDGRKPGEYFIAESKRRGFRRVVIHLVKFYWKI